MNAKIHLLFSAKTLWQKLAMLCIAIILFEMLFCLVSASTHVKSELHKDIGEVPKTVQKVMGEGFIESVMKYGIVAIGYIHPFMFLIYILFVFISVSQIITSEISTGTMAFLLSRPVSRIQIFINWVIITVGGLTLLALSSYSAVVAGLRLFNKDKLSLRPFLPLTTNLLIIMIFLASYIGFIAAISSTGKRMRNWGGFIILFLYLADVMSPVWEFLSYINWLNPFNYFQPMSIIMQRYISTFTGIILLFVSGLIFTTSAYIFKKRDLLTG